MLIWILGPSITVDTGRYPGPSQFAAGPLSQDQLWKLTPKFEKVCRTTIDPEILDVLHHNYL